MLPDYGYVVVATAQDLSGSGGRRLLGVVPPGHPYGVIFQDRCTGPTLHATNFALSRNATWKNLILGVFSADGHLQVGTSAPKPFARHCASLVGTPGGGSTLAGSVGSAAGSSRPEPVFVVAAPGIAWRVTLEISRGTSPPRPLPKTLGTCPSDRLGWAASPGTQAGPAVDYSLRPEGNSVTPPCRLSLPIRLGLYLGGTETPLPISGNGQSATLSGRYQGGPPFLGLTWRWSNWCGSRRPVQAVYFGPGGAVIASTTHPLPLPACVDPAQPSRLVLLRPH